MLELKLLSCIMLAQHKEDTTRFLCTLYPLAHFVDISCKIKLFVDIRPLHRIFFLHFLGGGEIDIVPDIFMSF